MSDKSESTKSPRPDPAQAQLDSIHQITEHARKEIEWERKYFSLQLKTLAWFITIGLALFTCFFFSNRSDMNAKMNSDVEEIKRGVDSKISDFQNEVTKRIDAQLNTDNVNRLISDKLTTQIGKITDEFITQKLNDAIEPKITVSTKIATDAKANAEKIVILLEEASKKITELNMLADLNILITRINNDDRDAFFQLIDWMKDKKDPYKSFAVYVINGALFKLDKEYSTPTLFSYRWAAMNKDENKVTLDEIIQVFNDENYINKPAVLKSFWGMDRFSKAEKISFIVSVVKDTPSLDVQNTAMRLVDDEINLKLNVTEFQKYIDWWNAHKNDPKYQLPVPSQTPSSTPNP